MAAKIRQGVNVVIVNHDGNATEDHVFAEQTRHGMVNLFVRYTDEKGSTVEEPILFAVSKVRQHGGKDMVGVLIIEGGLFTFQNPPHKFGTASGTYHPKMKTGQLIADLHDD
jgi:hypothetical protein